MKLKAILFYVILMFVFANCQTNTLKKDTVNLHTNQLIKTTEKPIKVTIKQLISSPEKYFGKLVQVYGYLQLELPDSFVYSSQESFAAKNTKDAIPFAESREDIYAMQQKFKSQYVLITATFGRIESAEFVGALWRIKSIDVFK